MLLLKDKEAGKSDVDLIVFRKDSIFKTLEEYLFDTAINTPPPRRRLPLEGFLSCL